MAKLCFTGPDPYDYASANRPHSGIDVLRGPKWFGKPFYASGEGTVVRLSHNSKGGYWIVVRYNGIPHEVGYAHMRSHAGCPRPGTKIHKGTQLGFVGNLGTNVTGPHVHVEILQRPTSTAVWDYFTKSCWVSGGSPASTGGGAVWDEAKKQRFLNQIGLDTGGIGNGWGAKSTAATKTFQKWVGLNDDGKFGPDTIDVAEIILNGGNFSKRPVKDIQNRLNELGYNVGKADGVWGPKASLGTYRLQRARKLKTDAQYGTATDAAAFPPAPKPDPKPTPVEGRNATSRPLKNLQAFLKVPTTDVWDKATSDAVAAFQTAQGLTVDRVWGIASDGLAFPPAGSLHGVDYSFARPDPKVLAARGVKHVGRYLHDSTKGLTRPEYDALRAAGIEVWLIFERDGKELLGGFSAGVEAAKLAERQRVILGLDEQPIYFNVDYDAPAADMPKILDALDGVASVIGLERVGLYAGIGPLSAAFDAGKITWGFQTYAWSGGKWDVRAQLQQWANGQWGGTVDFTRAMAAEYGQHAVEAPVPVPDAVLVPKAELAQMRSELEALQKQAGMLAAQVTDWLS